MYITKTGCQWRMLPKDFGPWQTVYFYFRKWKFVGVFEELTRCLGQAVRKAKGREVSPSIGIIDSRSVRTSHHIDSHEYGIDGGYRGKLAEIVKSFGWELSVVLRPEESSKKFQVLPLRWIVERTFSWIENYRRMTTDYEYKTDSAEAMLQITFCQIMLKKLIQ